MFIESILFAVPILLAGTVLLPIPGMLITLFLLLGIEGFLKMISGYNPVVHIGADLYMMLIVIKGIIVSATSTKSKKSNLPPLTVLIVIHFLWFLITFLNPYQLSLFASIAAMKMYVTMVLLFFFAYKYTDSAERVKSWFKPWVLVMFLHVVFSIWQASIGEESVTRIHPGYRLALTKFIGYAFRPFGFTALAGGPAVFIFLVNAFVLYFLFESKKFKIQLFSMATVCMSWLTLFLCQGRSAILKTVLSTGLFFLFYFKYGPRPTPEEEKAKRKKRKKFPFRLVAVPVVMVIALSFSLKWITTENKDMVIAVDRSATAFEYDKMKSARENTFSRFFELMQEIPLGAGLSRTGAAAGKFADVIKANSFFKFGIFTDNFWLAVLVDLGLPGVILMTTMVIVVLWKAFRNLGLYHDRKYQLLHATILCCIAGSVIGFYGAESILYNPEAGFFWFFSGVLFKLPELDRMEYQNTIHKGIDV